MAKKPFALAAAVLMMLGASNARAQVSNGATCPDDGTACSAFVSATASITIGRVLYIEVNSGTIDFPNPTGADFQAGSIASTTTHSLTHSGNVAHDVTLQAAADVFTYAGTRPDPGKLASDLEYSTNGGGSYTAVSGASGTADVLHGAAAPNTYSDETIDYRLVLNYSDVPGTYTLDVNYTVVAN